MKYLNKFETNESYDSVKKVAHKSYVSLVTDSDTVVYDKNINEGVYIQHIDGTLYTTNEWTAGGFVADDANGVAVVDKKCSFVVAKNYLSIGSWTAYKDRDTLLEGVFTTSEIEIAFTDYNGVANTAYIIEQSEESAAIRCNNYVFPNGSIGYLGSVGEWSVLCKYFDEVQNALRSIGEVFIREFYAWHWTSTQSNKSTAWIANTSTTLEFLDVSKTNSTYSRTRPFTTLCH